MPVQLTELVAGIFTGLIKYIFIYNSVCNFELRRNSEGKIILVFIVYGKKTAADAAE
jgi:hypothetical protein